jgi:hypothetical protein
MSLIEVVQGELPSRLGPDSIDAVRPRKCMKCGAVAGEGPGLLFHGHGSRDVQVVVPGENWLGKARMMIVACRRFLCKKCGATPMLYPAGVVPRYLYSLLAILAAWWFSVEPPVGEGLDEEEVYARQGVDRLQSGPEKNRTGKRRWPSLSRWAARIESWWPGRAVVGNTWRARVSSLLAGFSAEASEAGFTGVLTRAVSSHASAGAAM